MTIEISSTALYIISAIALIIIVLLVIIKFRNRSQDYKDAYANNTNSLSNTKKNDINRQERRRRKKAAKKIEKSLNSELEIQSKMLMHYILDLKSKISPVEKKIFFNITNSSSTNPYGLFNKLRMIFSLNSDDTIYYCRRNNTVVGADDFFIISEKGFSCGDSNGESWTLKFEDVKEIEDFGAVKFNFYTKSDSKFFLWDYILYNGSVQERLDFVDATNNFLDKYETVEDIFERAAMRAFYERCTSLLKKLTDQIGIDGSLRGKFIRAAYHYTLAADGVNSDHNLQQCKYMLNEIEEEMESWENVSIEELKGSYPLYGECKYWEARVAWRLGEDEDDLKQIVKELQGKDYHTEIREAAVEMYKELFHNN